jgi:hypothetical protein
MAERIAALPDTHGESCGGLLGRCPDCIRLYRACVGDQVPFCVLCSAQHWAYDPHPRAIGSR